MATNDVLVAVASAVFAAGKYVLRMDDKDQPHRMHQSDWRERQMGRLINEPLKFPMVGNPFGKLLESLEQSWSRYAAEMDSLEEMYISQRFPGRLLSRGMQRTVRLPTSYLRIKVTRELDGGKLILPVFKPVGRVED